MISVCVFLQVLLNYFNYESATLIVALQEQNSWWRPKGAGCIRLAWLNKQHTSNSWLGEDWDMEVHRKNFLHWLIKIIIWVTSGVWYLINSADEFYRIWRVQVFFPSLQLESFAQLPGIDSVHVKQLLSLGRKAVVGLHHCWSKIN